MCKTEVLIEYLGIKRRKKCSQERNQRSAILEYLVAQYMYMFPGKQIEPGTVRKEGDICWLQLIIESIQSLLSWFQED